MAPWEWLNHFLLNNLTTSVGKLTLKNKIKWQKVQTKEFQKYKRGSVYFLHIFWNKAIRAFLYASGLTPIMTRSLFFFAMCAERDHLQNACVSVLCPYKFFLLSRTAIFFLWMNKSQLFVPLWLLLKWEYEWMKALFTLICVCS